MYSKIGWACVPPERLLLASPLTYLHSVCSEQAFCEELEHNLLVALTDGLGEGNLLLSATPETSKSSGRQIR
jgi:hypothetical protein